MPTFLKVTKEEAFNSIQERIDKVQEILSRNIQTEVELRRVINDYTQWSKINILLLKRLFSDSSMAEQYSNALQPPQGFLGGRDLTVNETFHELKEDIEKEISELTTIQEGLEIITKYSITSAASDDSEKDTDSKKNIFIVHGRDDVKEKVARFVEKIGFDTTIFSEKPNKGQVIIEKLENLSNVNFVIVLLTPDDVGKENRDDEELKPRPRQNVVFELGYFIGKKGRNKVCALYKGNFDILTDFQGVLYIPLDDNEGWHTKLIKEIKAAGLPVDESKITK